MFSKVRFALRKGFCVSKGWEQVVVILQHCHRMMQDSSRAAELRAELSLSGHFLCGGCHDRSACNAASVIVVVAAAL